MPREGVDSPDRPGYDEMETTVPLAHCCVPCTALGKALARHNMLVTILPGTHKINACAPPSAMTGKQPPPSPLLLNRHRHSCHRLPNRPPRHRQRHDRADDQQRPGQQKGAGETTR
jgi:hypothetical protein